jgi:ABC-2 type transport system ATP-binding protein
VEIAIEVDNLTRVFDDRKRRDAGGKRLGKQQFVALDNVALTVREGEVRGLLGPNGAGKTTLVKILSTVLLPSSGRAVVLGYDIVKSTDMVRRSIGVVFGGERGLYGRLTPRQNLEYWAAAYQLGRAAARARVAVLIEQFGLASFADTPVDRISRGMKQRVHLARGMLSEPRLLFLDEPTIGMDPVAARELHWLLAGMRNGRTTMLLTTHDMAEAEKLCDQVTLINQGRIIGTESPQEVGRWITAYERVEARIADERMLAALRSVPGVVSVERIEDGWVRISAEAAGAVAAVLRLIVDAGITALRVGSPSLQDVYLELFGDRGMRV